MRLFVIVVAVLLVLLPILLILFAPARPLRSRILWASAAFLAPLATVVVAQSLPHLTNNAADAAQWQRFAGIMLAGSGFFAPWIIFATFLHGDKRS